MRSLSLSANACPKFSISWLMKLSICVVKKSVPSFSLGEVATDRK